LAIGVDAGGLLQTQRLRPVGGNVCVATLQRARQHSRRVAQEALHHSSSDASASLITSFCACLPRVVAFHGEGHQGRAVALARGVVQLVLALLGSGSRGQRSV